MMAEITRSHRLGVLLVTGSTVIGAGLLYLAVAAAQVGHGTYVPAMMLFPYTMLSAVALDAITAPFAIVAVIQFPLYGILVWIGLMRNRSGAVATTLAVLHLLAAFGCYLAVPVSFQ